VPSVGSTTVLEAERDMNVSTDSPLVRNELLKLLPEDERQQLLQHMTLLPYRISDVLAPPGPPSEFAYFPDSLIASVVALPKGERIEAVSVGREGFVGIAAILKGETLTETIVQIAGEAYRISAKRLVALLPELPVLAALLNHYMLIMFEEVSLTAACNRAHPLAERCAKWLLLVADRHDESVFLLTHKFLATMLGVRRAGVTVAAGTLQRAGIIKYSRGKVTIMDREALEKATCECYKMVNKLQRSKCEVSGSGNGRALISL
jgi:CRP-like cAMP-binding protein